MGNIFIRTWAGIEVVKGFINLQWTLMSYMIEGGGSRTLTKSKAWLYKYPQESAQLLDKICDVVIAYLVEQVKSGAQVSLCSSR
jgi:uroporphyrinogen decarboxylase